MKIDVTGQMEINASAEKVWQIVAHEFADIGKSTLPGPNQCAVTIRGEVELQLFPGLLIAPIMKLQLRRLGKETTEELKYFVENDRPHPRKVKASKK
ncbi:MAG: hypothetical protein KC421_09700 [Anaerolineales bacterium]|nr:hypothetical protein [Anaerolineales bacterium]